MRTIIKVMLAAILLFAVVVLPFAAGWVAPAFTLRSVIDLPATQKSSWRTLSDFSRYPDWNPYLPKIEGEFKNSAVLAVTLIDGNFEGPKVVMPRLTEITAPNRFCWGGVLLIPGIFDTRHCFVLHAINEQSTRFEQGEGLGGQLLLAAGRAAPGCPSVTAFIL